MIKNIEDKVRLAGRLSALSFLLCFCICACVSFFAWRQLSDAGKSIYILDASGNPERARQTGLAVNRAAEYRAHIARFHSLFFTLTPDDKFIEYQMKQAMYLVDESGIQQYNNLKEKGFFSSVLASSALLTIKTDSVYLDEPRHYFRYYGTQKIDRRSAVVVRQLITEGYLKDLEMRSDNNPHGVLITRWKTLQNKDLTNESKNAFQ
ncbi:MAG: conjugative transposon protein TraK [Sphingobacteriales bacterium]|nr:MAG: conjugative transposon protein TraK [Sphingobacteriales bacterium]